MTAVRLAVDPVSCDAYGYCAELLPELVELDEWGYPVVAGEAVPLHLARRARDAARQCPRRALLLLPAPTPSPSDRSAPGPTTTVRLRRPT